MSICSIAYYMGVGENTKLFLLFYHVLKQNLLFVLFRGLALCNLPTLIYHLLSRSKEKEKFGVVLLGYRLDWMILEIFPTLLIL